MASKDLRVTICVPHEIGEDSWLHEPRFAWFVRGYTYAMTQTRALPALSQVTPEHLYEAVWAVMRGAGLPDPESGFTSGRRQRMSGVLPDLKLCVCCNTNRVVPEQIRCLPCQVNCGDRLAGHRQDDGRETT